MKHLGTINNWCHMISKNRPTALMQWLEINQPITAGLKSSQYHFHPCMFTIKLILSQALQYIVCIQYLTKQHQMDSLHYQHISVDL